MKRLTVLLFASVSLVSGTVAQAQSPAEQKSTDQIILSTSALDTSYAIGVAKEDGADFIDQTAIGTNPTWYWNKQSNGVVQPLMALDAEGRLAFFNPADPLNPVILIDPTGVVPSILVGGKRVLVENAVGDSGLVAKAVSSDALLTGTYNSGGMMLLAAALGGYEAGGGSASGDYSVSIGKSSLASAGNAVAMGVLSQAQGGGATSIGGSTIASGTYSIALGYGANATHRSALAIGSWAKAYADYSSALGDSARTDGEKSIALGGSSLAQGIASISTGVSSKATGDYSIAHGFGSHASLRSGLAFGPWSKAYGEYASAFGDSARAEGRRSFSAGHASQATGEAASAIGADAKATARYANAIGFGATADGLHAYAHGVGATASGGSSFAASYKAKAIGDSTVAIGNYASTTAQRAIAIGTYAEAGENQVSIGSFNKVEPSQSGILFMFANGTSTENRSNALTITRDGKATILHKNYIIPTVQTPSPSQPDALEVQGNARVKGTLVLEQPAGDIPMGGFTATPSN